MSMRISGVSSSMAPNIAKKSSEKPRISHHLWAEPEV